MCLFAPRHGFFAFACCLSDCPVSASASSPPLPAWLHMPASSLRLQTRTNVEFATKKLACFDLVFLSIAPSQTSFVVKGPQYPVIQPNHLLTELLLPHSRQADLRLQRPRSTHRAPSGSALSRSTALAQGLFRTHLQGFRNSHSSNQPRFPLSACCPACL